MIRTFTPPAPTWASSCRWFAALIACRVARVGACGELLDLFHCVSRKGLGNVNSHDGSDRLDTKLLILRAVEAFKDRSQSRFGRRAKLAQTF